MRIPTTPSPSHLIEVALEAIARARTAHDELVDALEDADILGGSPLPPRTAWGCAIVARRVEADERWVADILDGEAYHDLVWPAASVIPAGSLLLQLVTESGASMPATPAVFAALERARAKLLGLIGVCWDAHAGGVLGDDDVLPYVDATLIPQAVRGRPLTMPTVFKTTISASACPSPIVLLCEARPPELMR